MSTFNGKNLQIMLINNRKSMSESAKLLNITVQELKSYFLFQSFQEDFINNIFKTLELRIVIEPVVYETVTPFALDIIEDHKKQIDLQSERIKALDTAMDEINKAVMNNSIDTNYKSIIEKYNYSKTEIWNKTKFFFKLKC